MVRKRKSTTYASMALPTKRPREHLHSRRATNPCQVSVRQALGCDWSRLASFVSVNFHGHKTLDASLFYVCSPIDSACDHQAIVMNIQSRGSFEYTKRTRSRTWGNFSFSTFETMSLSCAGPVSPTALLSQHHAAGNTHHKWYQISWFPDRSVEFCAFCSVLCLMYSASPLTEAVEGEEGGKEPIRPSPDARASRHPSDDQEDEEAGKWGIVICYRFFGTGWGASLVSLCFPCRSSRVKTENTGMTATFDSLPTSREIIISVHVVSLHRTFQIVDIQSLWFDHMSHLLAVHIGIISLPSCPRQCVHERLRNDRENGAS